MYGGRKEKHRQSLKNSKRLPRGGNCNFAKEYIFINKDNGGKYHSNSLVEFLNIIGMKDYQFQNQFKKMKKDNKKTVLLNGEYYYVKKVG